MKDNVQTNRSDFAIIYFTFVYVSESSLGYSSKLVLNNHALSRLSEPAKPIQVVYSVDAK